MREFFWKSPWTRLGKIDVTIFHQFATLVNGNYLMCPAKKCTAGVQISEAVEMPRAQCLGARIIRPLTQFEEKRASARRIIGSSELLDLRLQLAMRANS